MEPTVVFFVCVLFLLLEQLKGFRAKRHLRGDVR